MTDCIATADRVQKDYLPFSGTNNRILEKNKVRFIGENTHLFPDLNRCYRIQLVWRRNCDGGRVVHQMVVHHVDNHVATHDSFIGVRGYTCTVRSIEDFNQNWLKLSTYVDVDASEWQLSSYDSWYIGLV